MADFASYTDEYGILHWINLAFIRQIDVGLDPHEPTTVIFTDGKSMALPHQEGTNLIGQLNLCCIPRPGSPSGSGSSSQKGQSQRPSATRTRKSPGSTRSRK